MNQSRILSSIASILGVKQSSTATKVSSLHDDVNPSALCVKNCCENIEPYSTYDHPVVENYNRNEILVDFPSRRRIYDEDNRIPVFGGFPTRRRRARRPREENERSFATTDHDEEAGVDHRPREEDERTLDATDHDEEDGVDQEQPQQDHPFARGFEFAQELADSTSTPSTLPPKRRLFPNISFKIQKSKKGDNVRQPIRNSVGYLPMPLLRDTLMGRRSSLPIIFQPTENEIGAYMECPRKITNGLNNHGPGVEQDQILSAIQNIAQVMAEESAQLRSKYWEPRMGSQVLHEVQNTERALIFERLL